jgi:L-serine dehydratase
MVGPSSSHTAGAVKLGRLARAIFGKEPRQVEIQLHGSFAKTYKGHGTDKALVAGLLNFEVDDEKIAKSSEVANEKSIDIKINGKEDLLGKGYHPNSVKFILKADDEKTEVIGSSIGGGNVKITDIDECKNLKITGEYETLYIIHKNRPGFIRDVTSIIASPHINVNYLESSTGVVGEKGYTLVSVNQKLPEAMVGAIKEIIEDVYKVILIRRI